jgi:hypothetical protein
MIFPVGWASFPVSWWTRAKILVTSKTVWGGIFAAVGWLLKQPHITLPNIIIAFGMILTTIGVRDSWTKFLGVPGVSPATEFMKGEGPS